MSHWAGIDIVLPIDERRVVIAADATSDFASYKRWWQIQAEAALWQ